MFLNEIVHIMSGRYLSEFIDWYCIYQNIFNTILVISVICGTIFNKYYNKN